jgi:AAA domain (dynein-related subfamily)
MKNIPKGAEALLIALNTPSFNGTIGIPALIWGKPGEGKSSFLEGLSQRNFPVLTLIASIHDPTDFSGLPIVHDDKVRYAMPEWIEIFEENGTGILFLDELTTAPPSVQAALLRVVLERKVGFHDLPKNVRIVSAANPPDLMTGGWELSPPLRNRFVHLQWELSASVYKEALINGYQKADLPYINEEDHAEMLTQYKLLLHAFLERNPNLLTSSPDLDRYGFASPRSWDYAVRLMASCSVLGLAPMGDNRTDARVFLELLAGCVGDGIAANFVGFLKNLKMPSPQKVLDRQEDANLKNLNESELFLLFTGFRALLRKDLPNEQLLSRGKVLMVLVNQVAELNRKDIIFPAMRQLAKDEHFLARMIASTANDPKTRQEVMAFVKGFFSDEGFNDYVNVLG